VRQFAISSKKIDLRSETSTVIDTVLWSVDGTEEVGYEQQFQGLDSRVGMVYTVPTLVFLNADDELSGSWQVDHFDGTDWENCPTILPPPGELRMLEPQGRKFYSYDSHEGILFRVVCTAAPTTPFSLNVSLLCTMFRIAT
jgi:hypothetical protein